MELISIIKVSLLLSLRLLFLVSVTFVRGLMVIAERKSMLEVPNGVANVRSARGSVMKKLANPEAVMWLGVGIIIVIGVMSSAIIYLCM